MLEIRHLRLHYGKHLALDDINLRVEANEAVVVLGANGAGKSSLLKAVAGLETPEPGTSIMLDGMELVARPAHRILEAGIAFVPEGRGIFGELSVAENLSLGAYAAHARKGEKQRLEEVYALFPRLAERRRQIVRTMSGGEQQMVAIGRALMSRPRLLMLDEPSLGLAPVLVEELFSTLERIRKTGMALLMVEQNVRASLALADRGYLIESGRIVGADTAEALARNPAVREAFLGHATAAGGKADPPA